ncbi:MAG: NAD(P)/FAD-dependent oxidoreductase [Gammaproteobacteria bacterium]|nr:MAG: NAD(P)/FAD-dependent oxidoreductase [Gammaproteobacteria bacterium]
MDRSEIFDVVVAGGGPGGAMAAKKCAEAGLRVLLLEKQAIPRDKVCSGLIMGQWAVQIMEREFGGIPQSALATPPLLTGHRFYVGAAAPEDLVWPSALSWRKDLDSWMVRRAADSGVRVWDETQVRGVSAEQTGYRIVFQRGETRSELLARAVIGADGATSAVRKSLYPDLRVRYSGPIRLCYQGALDLDKQLFHWFFPKSLPRPRFNVNHKGDVFLVEGSALQELQSEAGAILARYGFDPAAQPLWKDGCAIALLHDALVGGSFKPGRGNVLLVGDAGGLILPITYEGIGSALKSAILAAEAVIDSLERGTDAAAVYLQRLQPMLRVIDRLRQLQSDLAARPQTEAGLLKQQLRDAYRETLTLQMVAEDHG